MKVVVLLHHFSINIFLVEAKPGAAMR